MPFDCGRFVRIWIVGGYAMMAKKSKHMFFTVCTQEVFVWTQRTRLRRRRHPRSLR